MASKTLTLKCKNMTYVTNYQNVPGLFVLEDIRPRVRQPNGDYTFTITCGLNHSYAVATRYVVDNGIALPMNGNEIETKALFEKQRGLTRAASVYYNLAECEAFARFQFTIDGTNVQRIKSYFLSIYAIPRVASKPRNGTMDCKPVELSPAIKARIVQFMLSSIWSRHILF